MSVKGHYICIYIYCSSVFFYLYSSDFMRFWSCKLVLISSNAHKESSWLFTSHLLVFRELSVEDFIFMLSKCFHFSISSAWFLLQISISSVPFLSLFLVLSL